MSAVGLSIAFVRVCADHITEAVLRWLCVQGGLFKE